MNLLLVGLIMGGIGLALFFAGIRLAILFGTIRIIRRCLRLSQNRYSVCRAIVYLRQHKKSFAVSFCGEVVIMVAAIIVAMGIFQRALN